MRKDRRYSIAREFCGHAKPRWVVRFCGDWVGQATTRREATLIKDEHRAHFLALLA